jgi:hypothetical protein
VVRGQPTFRLTTNCNDFPGLVVITVADEPQLVGDLEPGPARRGLRRDFSSKCLRRQSCIWDCAVELTLWSDDHPPTVGILRWIDDDPVLGHVTPVVELDRGWILFLDHSNQERARDLDGQAHDVDELLSKLDVVAHT